MKKSAQRNSKRGPTSLLDALERDIPGPGALLQFDDCTLRVVTGKDHGAVKTDFRNVDGVGIVVSTHQASFGVWKRPELATHMVWVLDILVGNQVLRMRCDDLMLFDSGEGTWFLRDGIDYV